jgi:hypothetical protein
VSAMAIEIRRRDPAVIAARAHAVLDAAAHLHADWPDGGRDAIGRAFIGLHVALEKYRLAEAGEDAARMAENACWAMATLLICVQVFMGRAAAREMERDAAAITAGGDAGTEGVERGAE